MLSAACTKPTINCWVLQQVLGSLCASRSPPNTAPSHSSGGVLSYTPPYQQAAPAEEQSQPSSS